MRHSSTLLVVVLIFFSCSIAISISAEDLDSDYGNGTKNVSSDIGQSGRFEVFLPPKVVFQPGQTKLCVVCNVIRNPGGKSSTSEGIYILLS